MNEANSSMIYYAFYEDVEVLQKKCISLWVSSINAKNIAYGKFMKQVSNLQVCVTFQHCGTLNSIKWWDLMCIAHHWRLAKELHWKGLGFCRVQSVVIKMNRVWFYAMHLSVQFDNWCWSTKAQKHMTPQKTNPKKQRGLKYAPNKDIILNTIESTFRKNI